MRFETLCARGPGADGDATGPVAPPIVASSTFRFPDQDAVDRYYDTGEGFVYSRYGNPTVLGAERMLAALEGTEDAALFGSGMAAISTTLLTLAGAGDRVAAQAELYGGSLHLLREVLPGLGIDVQWLSREDLAEADTDRLRGAKLLYLETPINPTLRLVDLRRAAELAHAAGVPVAVDGTFATPFLQRPCELGVDLVLHSTSKYLGGHSDLIGGAVAGPATWIDRIRSRRRALGATMDPFTAFLLQRGMRTLAVRMNAHCAGAAAVAGYLSGHERVERVWYPGLEGHPDAGLLRDQMRGAGGMVSFAVRGGEPAAVAVHDRLRLFARAGSLGGVESLVSIPARMSHRSLDATGRLAIGVPPNMLRLSIGLESPADLVADLERALGG